MLVTRLTLRTSGVSASLGRTLRGLYLGLSQVATTVRMVLGTRVGDVNDIGVTFGMSNRDRGKGKKCCKWYASLEHPALSHLRLVRAMGLNKPIKCSDSIVYQSPCLKRNAKAMITYLQYFVIQGLALVMDTRQILATVNRFDTLFSDLDDQSQQKLAGVLDLVEAIQTAERTKAEEQVHGRLARAEALLEVFYDFCLIRPRANTPVELEAMRVNERLRQMLRERVIAALDMKDVGELVGKGPVKPAHRKRAREALSRA